MPTPPPPAQPSSRLRPKPSSTRRSGGRLARLVVPEEASLSLVGDFNGDGAQDIAVPVAPAPGRLAEINDPVAGWQLQDALAEPPSAVVPRGGTAPVVEPVKVGEADALLAVIHGYGAAGMARRGGAPVLPSSAARSERRCKRNPRRS